MSNVFIVGYAGWSAYDTFLIVSLSSRPVYDSNPLRLNPNPKKRVSGSCRVCELGRTLTPLVKRELVSLCIVYLLCILALYFTHLFNHMHICLVQHVKICKDAEGHAYTLCILNSMDQLFIIGRWVFCPLGIMPP